MSDKRDMVQEGVDAADAAEGTEAPVTDTVEVPRADAAAPADTVTAADASSATGAKARGKAPLIAGLAAVVALLACVLGFSLSSRGSDGAADAVAAAGDAMLRINVVAPGYDSSSAPIPIHVVGVTATGESVGVAKYLEPANADDLTLELELEDGEYDVTVGATVTGSGEVLASDAATHVVVEEGEVSLGDDAASGEADADGDATASFELGGTTVADLTDEGAQALLDDLAGFLTDNADDDSVDPAPFVPVIKDLADRLGVEPDIPGVRLDDGTKDFDDTLSSLRQAQEGGWSDFGGSEQMKEASETLVPESEYDTYSFADDALCYAYADLDGDGLLDLLVYLVDTDTYGLGTRVLVGAWVRETDGNVVELLNTVSPLDGVKGVWMVMSDGRLIFSEYDAMGVSEDFAFARYRVENGALVADGVYHGEVGPDYSYVYTRDGEEISEEEYRDESGYYSGLVLDALYALDDVDRTGDPTAYMGEIEAYYATNKDSITEGTVVEGFSYGAVRITNETVVSGTIDDLPMPAWMPPGLDEDTVRDGISRVLAQFSAEWGVDIASNATSVECVSSLYGNYPKDPFGRMVTYHIVAGGTTYNVDVYCTDFYGSGTLEAEATCYSMDNSDQFSYVML